MLRLKLFGAGDASYQGNPLPGFPNQQPFLLLCYLLLNRDQLHPREQLATVFWQDYSSTTSRKYLRNALWRLRNTFQSVGIPQGAYLHIDDENISFSHDSPYRLDVEQFEEVAKRYQDISGEELTSDMAQQLERTVQLYSGDLLEGVYQDWCLYDRERLRLLYLNTLEKLMFFHKSNGTYEHGITYGKRILAYEETREKVHRQMMLLHWLAGDRDAAIAQYHRCAQTLDDALSIGPSDATWALYRQIVQHETPVGVNPDVEEGGEDHTEESPQTTRQVLQRIRELRGVIRQADTELQSLERLVQTMITSNGSRQPR